jgi:hypothetical protein
MITFTKDRGLTVGSPRHVLVEADTHDEWHVLTAG